ncbi:MAG: hypothetical protein ABIG96_03115 [Candidatus Micrarchaeota archaeon]
MGILEGKSLSLRAQSAVEFLIILTVGLLLLAFVISTSQQRITGSQQALAFSIAKGSVDALAKAADSVHYEGVGSKRQVKFTIPEGAIGAIIQGNSFKISISTQGNVADASAMTQATICTNSKLPEKIGTYTVTVEGLDGCVLIGSGSNLTVSTTLISVRSYANASLTKSVVYSNEGSTPIDVLLNLTFISPDVKVDLLNPSDSSFTLAAGMQKEVQLNITISSTALQTQTGSLIAEGGNGENLTTAIIISVESQECGSQLPCIASSDVAEIEIETYASASYSHKKEIFNPPETIAIQGGSFDPNTALSLDVRNPSDAASIAGYPKALTTNSSGGFKEEIAANLMDEANGYIIRASGVFGGMPVVANGNFNVNACT